MHRVGKAGGIEQVDLRKEGEEEEGSEGNDDGEGRAFFAKTDLKQVEAEDVADSKDIAAGDGKSEQIDLLEDKKIGEDAHQGD